jgi:uncharacterized RDD family membrane protein YckC
VIPVHSSTTRPSRLALWCQWAAVLWLCANPLAAQPEGPPAERRPRDIHIAASENCLWLIVVDESQSRLFFRDPEGTFAAGPSTQRRIVAQTALDRDLLVFFDDGALYRYSPTDAPPTAESVLPQRKIPLEMVGGDRRVWAIISSATAAELPTEVADEPQTQPHAFDPGNSTYSLAVFDGRRWSAVAPLPASVRSPGNTRLRPRLCLARGSLLLLAPGEQPDQIRCFYLDHQKREWLSHGPIPMPRLLEFHVANVSRVPTLVAMLRGAAAGAELSVLRLLGDPALADADSWRPGKLELSGLPDGVPGDQVITRDTDVVGFNQHLALLAWTTAGEAYVRFARIDARPAEPTVAVEQVLAQPGVFRRGQGALQFITLGLLLAVLVGLFVFRRGSMVHVVELPAGCALALNMQRLAAWLIDFVPFTVVAAVSVGIPWGQGLGALGRWGISPNPQGGLPDENVLLWWGLSIAGYTAYSLVMELLVGRTVGKVIARVRLISEAGTRPTAGQILTRNLTRLIEFMPQFWVFVVLVLLSRNRQRMGDIFARTVVIRPLPGKPAAPTKTDETTARRDPGGPKPAEKDDEHSGPPGPDQE